MFLRAGCCLEQQPLAAPVAQGCPSRQQARGSLMLTVQAESEARGVLAFVHSAFIKQYLKSACVLLPERNWIPTCPT